MLGWALDSLRYRIRKAEREWRAANPVDKQYAYGPLRRRLVEMSGRPLRWASLYALCLVLWSVNAWLWPTLYPRWAVFVRLSNPFPGAGHGLSAELAYLTAVWTVQATLAGLVYPIVISFVTILLQRRYNAKAILSIYLADSAAIPSGLGALALVGVVGSQYLLVPLVPSAVIPLWVALDGVVFLWNLWLTANFLYRTFEFIRPDRRADIIRRYAINVSWPQELRECLVQQFYEKFINEPQENSAVVITTNKAALLYRGDIIDVSVRVPKLSRVLDVRLRILHWAFSDWRKRAMSPLREANNAQSGTTSHHSLAAHPVLVMPLPLDKPVDSGSTILCQTDAWYACSGRAQWLIRHAYVFKPAQNTHGPLRISDILGEVQAEALLAIQANETQTFKDRLSEWVDLYCHLISEAPFRNSPVRGNSQSDRVSDWGSPPVQIFWKSRISQIAAISVRELADAAVGKLNTNTEFVLALIRTFGELHRRLRESLHPGAFLDYFGLLPIVFARVQVWWVTTAEQNGNVEHTPCHGVLLRPPFSGTYRPILRTFGEEWKRWQKEIIPAQAKNNSGRQSGLAWSVLQNGAEYLHAHMRETLMLFFGCVQRGDKEGAEWFLDVLLTWRAQIEPHDVSFIVEGLPRRNWLTLEGVVCTWDEAKENWAALWDPGWKKAGERSSVEPRAPESIFWAALRNYWIDGCYIAMLGLMAVGKECLCEASLVADLLGALVFEKTSGIALNARNERPLHDSREWLFVLLRFYEAYLSPGEPPLPQYSYRLRLHGIWNEIVGWDDETRVSGARVFTEGMRTDALLVIWLMLDLTTIPHDDIGKLKEWVAADLYRAEVFVRYLTGMRVRLGSAEFEAEYRGIAECVVALAEGEEFDERVMGRGEALGELVGRLEEIIKSAVTERPISGARIKETGRHFSSSKIFTPQPWHFPVKLFGGVCEVAAEGARGLEGVQNRSVVFSVPRTAFIESYIGNPDARDNLDRMKLQFEKEVATSLFMSAIEKLRPNDINVGAPQEWWTKVKDFAEACRKSGLQPLCVLAGQTLPDWLLSWARPGRGDDGGKPADLRLWSNPEWSQVDGYVGNLEDVPAFHCVSPASQSYLLTRESLDRVTFVRWEDGDFVRASVNKDQNDYGRVVLQLAWRARVDAKEGPALQLEIIGWNGLH